MCVCVFVCVCVCVFMCVCVCVCVCVCERQRDRENVRLPKAEKTVCQQPNSSPQTHFISLSLSLSYRAFTPGAAGASRRPEVINFLSSESSSMTVADTFWGSVGVRIKLKSRQLYGNELQRLNQIRCASVKKTKPM